MDEDELVPINLRRPFLATTNAVIDVHEGKLSLKELWVDIVYHDEKWIEYKEEEDSNKALAVSFYPRIEPEKNQLPVVISSALSTDENQTPRVLQNHKGAITWSIADIKGIDSSFFTHKILMKDDPWVNPVQVVPKKGWMTVVKNEKDELIPQRTVTGWRVCIDYHGFSRYFQIPITPKDQEKTTFTCPYGTFTYKRMPFGLCNAPATFQRCMTSIFHELIEDRMEVFMDNFSVFGSSFDHCLKNLEKMLKRCEETNLVLNWEKCHFMVKEGIVLGHKVSGSRIEVDKAKFKAISKLPYPTNVKSIRSFLGHTGFYR
ncbi:putative nucleotidyltransferase, ribonuclease H, partial [Tanacetum coccineum]